MISKIWLSFYGIKDVLQYEFWKPPQLKQSNINSSIYVVCKIHIYDKNIWVLGKEMELVFYVMIYNYRCALKRGPNGN